jgi:hypothetical protein
MHADFNNVEALMPSPYLETTVLGAASTRYISTGHASLVTP